MSALYRYDDAHNHRLTIAATTDGLSQPYVSLGADCMDIGGEMANVWLTVPVAERLVVALAERVPFEHTDHMGDALTVAPAADWTTFTVVRAPREDDETPVTVRVVVLSARLPEVRAALVAAGSAGVLPVPGGPEPRAESLPLKVVAELNDLRMRLAGMANPPREVYLALYEGAVPELFTTVEAARECCDDLAKTDAHGKCWDWQVNESGVHVQFWTHPDDDRPLSETSGTVTPIVVQGDDDLSELETLLARVAELKAKRADEHDELALALGHSNGTEWGDLVEFAAGAVSVEAKLRARVAELEAAAYGNATVRLFDPVGQIRHLHESLAAQKSRADTLDRLLREKQEQGVEPESSGAYPPALPWARLMDAEDLADFLDELAASAITHASQATALAEVEKTCATWRLIAEAQHAHNTAPGPDAEEYVAPAPSCTRCYGADAARFVAGGGAVSPCRVCGTDDTAGPSADKLSRTFAPVASLREDMSGGEHYQAVHHDYRTGRDMPETGSTK